MSAAHVPTQAPAAEFQPRMVSGPGGAPSPQGHEPDVPPKNFWDINLTKPKVKLLDIALFASQWQAMESAGIPTVTTIGLLSRATRRQSPRLSDSLDDIVRMVSDGMSLADA